MAAALEFALGLATGNFLSAIAGATDGVKGLVGAMFSVGAMIEGVQAAIEKGAGLEALHKRTGESVASLYQLQAGFKAAGLSGDDVQSTLLHMQRALGGVNEMGEKTPDIFRQMGLDIETLRKQNGAQQLQSIISGLSTLNGTAAASAAGSIFGRNDYANIIQLKNSMGDVSDAMKEAAAQGQAWQRIGAAFEKIELSLNKVKSMGMGFFAGIAEGLVPAMDAALKWILSFQNALTNIGHSIGNIFKGITQAYKETKLEELVKLTFAAGVEFFQNMLVNTLGSGSFWEGIFEVMVGNFIVQWVSVLKLVMGIGTLLTAAFDTAFQKLFELIGKTPKLGEALGLSGYKASSFRENYDARRNEGSDAQGMLNDIIGMGSSLAADGAKNIASGVAAAWKNSGGPAQAALEKYFNGLISRSPMGLMESAKLPPPGEGKALDHIKGNYKMEGDELTKMGFIMGGANPMMDYARRTAVATEQMVHHLQTKGKFNHDTGVFTVTSVNAV
jgi:hypothetical protein